MARDYVAYGSSFLKGVLAKIGNAEKRAQLEQLFADADVAAIVPEIGQGVFMQSDYSRAMNESSETLKAETTKLKAHEERLTSWWEANQSAVLAYKKLVDDGTIAEDGTVKAGVRPAGTEPGALTMKEVEKFFGAREEMAASYINTTTRLASQHLKDFGEVLNVDTLVAHAKKTGKYLDDAYTDLFKAKIDERATQADEARIAKRIADEKVKWETDHAAQHTPYPVRPGADTSPLAVLEQQAPSGKGVEDAIAAYESLTAARGA